MGLSIDATRVLSAIDERRSFTRAADALGMAQPSVSQRVARLEDELSTLLIDRKSRRATAAGRILIERGRRAERELSIAQDELDALLGLRTGLIRIGITHWIGAFDLAAVLAEFHRDHPGIDVSLSEDNAETMLRMLASLELDLVISNVGSGELVSPGIEQIIISEEPLTLVAAPGVVRGRRAEQALAILKDLDMVGYGSSTTLRQTIDQAAAEMGLSPRVAFSTSQPDIMHSLIVRGMAWSIVPHSLARSWAADVRSWPLEMQTTRLVGLNWSLGSALHPAAAAFRDHLQTRTSHLKVRDNARPTI